MGPAGFTDIIMQPESPTSGPGSRAYYQSGGWDLFPFYVEDSNGTLGISLK